MERATAKLSLISQVIHIHVQRRRMPSMAGMSRGERRAHADQDDRVVRCMRRARRARVARQGASSGVRWQQQGLRYQSLTIFVTLCT